MLKNPVEIQNSKIETGEGSSCFCNLYENNTTSCRKSLVAEINYVMKINPYENSAVGFLRLDENLTNEKVRTLVYELAAAIDKNSENEIKILKSLYGTSKEFAQAKEFLNAKCKEVWDVFDNKKVKMKLPQKAMKALGITNKPDLGFILDNCLKYFEKDNSAITVNTISSVLNNVNLDYSLDDICEYLKMAHQRRTFEYNSYTVKFLANRLDFNKKKLEELGISKQQINNVLKTLTIKEKIRCIKNYYLG